MATSKHASKRCQQRGFTKGRISMIYENADVFLPAGNGSWLVRVSRDVARSLPDGESISGIALIETADGQLQTALHIMNGSKGRRYRRGRDAGQQYLAGRNQRL